MFLHGHTPGSVVCALLDLPLPWTKSSVLADQQPTLVLATLWAKQTEAEDMTKLKQPYLHLELQ